MQAGTPRIVVVGLLFLITLLFRTFTEQGFKAERPKAFGAAGCEGGFHGAQVRRAGDGDSCRSDDS